MTTTTNNSSRAYPTTVEVGDIITLSGIKYTVLKTVTADEQRAAGFHNVARMMDHYDCEFDLICKRGRGTKRQHILRAMRTSQGFLAVSYCMAI